MGMKRAFLVAVALLFSTHAWAGDDPVTGESCPKLGTIKLDSGGTNMFGCLCDEANACDNGLTTRLHWRPMIAEANPVRQMLDRFGMTQWPAYIVCYTPSFDDGMGSKYNLVIHFYGATGRIQGLDPTEVSPNASFNRIEYGPVEYNNDGTIIVMINGKSTASAATAGCPAKLNLDGRTFQYPQG